MFDNFVKGYLTFYIGAGRIMRRFSITGKSFKLVGLIFFCVFIAFSANAATYYVSNSGNDSNSGTTPEMAWRTIDKVNKSKFAPGDQILFKRGDEWREQLTVPASDLTFDAYGSGAKPVINGSKILNKWEKIGTNLYVKIGAQNPQVLTLINGVYGTLKKNSKSLSEQNDWFWTDSGSDSLFIYTTDTTLIEAGTIKFAIIIIDKNNIEIKNLNIKSSGWHNIDLRASKNINIDNCLIEQAGYQGINVDGGTIYYNISNNSILLNGGNGIYLSGYANYGEIYNNTIIGNGIGPDGDRQAIGLWISNNINIYNNKIIHSPTGINRFALEFTTDVKAYNKNIRFYNNVVKASNVTRILSVSGGDYAIEYNIFIGDGNGYGIHTDDVEENEIKVYAYNNVIDSTNYAIWIYEDGYVPAHISPNSKYVIKNNIISNSATYHIRLGVGAESNILSQTLFDYNIFDDDSEKKFRWGVKSFKLIDWQEQLNQDVNSSIAKPLFTDTKEYSIKPESPAVNAGIDVGLTHDIYGNPIVGTPDIGAVELQKIDKNINENFTENISICEGSSYQGWTESGQYERVLITSSGADSVVTTNLTVNPVIRQSENIEIREGESYRGWTQAGEYKTTYTSSTGCDSIVITHLTVVPFQNQSIQLDAGWNIFSSRLNPKDHNIAQIFSQLINKNQLLAVQDEAGNTFDSQNDKWINAIGNFNFSEGYKIQVKSDVNLNISGHPVQLPLNIELKEGWNIIPYPFKESSDAMKIIQPLIDAKILIKVQDEQGNSVEHWGNNFGWINGIGSFSEGEGYWVQVAKSGTLTLYENYEKSGLVLDNNLSTSFYKVDYVGNGSGHMNINIINLKETGLTVGDEIAAFYNDVCVGAVRLSEQNIALNAVSLPASMADENGQKGFIEGTPIEIRTWKSNQNIDAEALTEVIEGDLVYQMHGSVFVQLKKETITSNNSIFSMKISCYPNPAKDKVTISFSKQPDAGTQIIIADITGKHILIHKVESLIEVINVQSLTSGTYFIKTTTSRGKFIINKLLIIK